MPGMLHDALAARILEGTTTWTKVEADIPQMGEKRNGRVVLWMVVVEGDEDGEGAAGGALGETMAEKGLRSNASWRGPQRLLWRPAQPILHADTHTSRRFAKNSSGRSLHKREQNRPI